VDETTRQHALPPVKSYLIINLSSESKTKTRKETDGYSDLPPMMKAERKSQLMTQSYDRNTYGGGGGYNAMMSFDDEREEMMKDLNRAENIYDMKHKGISKDDFEMVKVIGRGGFGKVYMVRKRSNGKIYAMKVLSKDQIASKNLNLKTRGKPGIIDTLVEREIMETIKSPFIVTLYYAFQTPEKLYFIMDFLNGGELFYHLRKEQRFDEPRARFYAAQLVCALECLHKNGIIYR